MQKKEVAKIVFVTTAFWLVVAGVVVLNMQTANASFAKGQAAGFEQAKQLLNK